MPGHWLEFGSRHSALTNTTRKGTTPANALLNYLYAILESETRIALLARGLDPEIGMFHSLQRFRNSLAHDVMEPVRPVVDGFVLELLATRVFSAADFVETREGSCRLAPDLARVLVNTSARWAKQVQPVVGIVATELLRRASSAGRTRGRQQSHFPGALRRRTANGSLPDVQVAPRPRCEDCGASISRPGYARCFRCERHRQAQLAPVLGGVQALARLRAAGADPAHAGKAGEKRSAIASQRHAEVMAVAGRERLTVEERERFRQDVLPLLAEATVGALAKATSLSKTYCSFIKRGLRTPHPRHWEALRAAGR